MAKKTEIQLLEEKLLTKKKAAFQSISDKKEDVDSYCGEYIDLINAAKTEREFAEAAENMMLASGFKAFDPLVGLKKRRESLF